MFVSSMYRYVVKIGSVVVSSVGRVMSTKCIIRMNINGLSPVCINMFGLLGV